jgi:hypothetical protein
MVRNCALRPCEEFPLSRVHVITHCSLKAIRKLLARIKAPINHLYACVWEENHSAFRFLFQVAMQITCWHEIQE